MIRERRGPRPDPETVGLRALAFLAADEEAMGGFLAATGADPGSLREAAREPVLLGAVLDHLLGDDALLREFLRAEKLTPEEVVAARDTLGGDPAWRDHA